MITNDLNRKWVGFPVISDCDFFFFSHGKPPVKQHRVLRPHPASKIYAHTVKILYMGAATLYTVYTATQNEEEEEKKKNVAQVGKRPLGLFS